MEEEIKGEEFKDKECNCNHECDCGSECTCDETFECHNGDNNCCDCLDSEESSTDGGGEKKNKKDKKDKHKEKIKELEEKIKMLEEQNLRTNAELINYRKRKDEEISRMLKYSSEDIVREILPIVDNFERAISMDDDNLEDEVSKFLSGFKMIYCKLVSILEKNGVKAIDGGNKPFDPTYHQAVMTEQREGVEAGMVIEVLQKGYLLKDKVIRPAMVKVSE